ncbi:winged helix-turn-helix domain-containing protein [Belnapia sp. T18]|uniref:Winged helix-turn-helix domain-containing protein n=1 Tax=Belnapia arida TaxID=2804533 RepID=A0ABS1UBA9_9PROT|nr:winged helix-turn-helix domain-containing protein [Belnapia arida]MBL6081977.1 winged helix-turn-helix domain-containing protein [Belnapia arida]
MAAGALGFGDTTEVAFMPAPELDQAPATWELDIVRRELRSRDRPVALGGRAFELLEILVLAAGELVTKQHLMARVWPGAIVEDNTLQVHISAIRKALGADRRLLQTASGRGYRLLGRWTVRRKDVTPVPQMPAASIRPAAGNLPSTASELIGRSDAIQHISVLLTAYRMVTLTGPGGIGKTSLALEVARQSGREFDDGAHVIEFATATDPALVPSTVARALGLTFGESQASAASVANAIGDRAMLLMLDNCEHLIDAAASMADEIIRLCPHVVILATSREMLRIAGECIYRVPPLSLPPEGMKERSEVLRHGAIRLFVARTRSSGFDFCAEGTDLGAVSAICRRLDGIPLAIEFAAARAATLGPELVLARLEDRFAHLTLGRRTALPRHQTLRAALDWSYDLLLAEEQCLLRHLAVFVGGFTLDAVVAVTRGRIGEGSTVAEILSTLVAKSLVSVEGIHEATRWHLLETLRAYALDKLRAAGEAREAAQRHAEHYRGLVERRPVEGGLEACGKEISNVRAALDWCFSDTGDAAMGVALAAAYAPVWLHLAVLPECREAIQRALERCGPAVDPRIRMRLHIALGFVLSYTAAPSERSIEDVLSEGLDIAESLGDIESQILALWGLSTLRMRDGDNRATKSLAERIQAAAKRSGKFADIAVGNRALGTALHYSGRHSAARLCLEPAAAMSATAARGDYEALLLTDVRIQSRAMLSRVLMLQGYADQARIQAKMSYEQALDANHRMSICFTLRHALCATYLTLRDMPAAEAAVAQLVDAAATFKFARWASQGRCLEAMLSIRRGDFVDGTAQLKTAIDANINGGRSYCYPEMLGALAEGLAGGGRCDEALATLAAAVEWSERNDETWYLPELFRLEGALAPHTTVAGARHAERTFLRAIRLSRRQGALLWELRAASSLALLRLSQERHAEAHRVLQPVFDRVTEGGNMIDVQYARALLSRLT